MSVISSAASTACLASLTASGGRRAITSARSIASVSIYVWGHPVHEPESQRLLGVDSPAGEHELHRALLADDARQTLRAAAAGDDPERDLGLAELGRLGGDDHVAQQRQLAPAAEREPRDGRDQRRAAIGDPLPERHRRGFSTSWNVRSAIALMSAPAANTSSLPAITMQCACSSASSFLDRRRELLHHLGRKRVPPLRPVRTATIPTCAVLLDCRLRTPTSIVYSGINALIPVVCRPMISFWICEVPSYKVVTRASRI